MKSVLIIGGGVIGLSTAYYAALRGMRVTVLDRSSETDSGCSFGNAGMIVPSHFIPLAAPGAVALGLKWMRNPESPFWIKPRLDSDLLRWGYQFWRAATPVHVARAAPLLRDLSFASRTCFEQLASATSNEFGLTTRGLLMLCKTQHALDEESHTAERARQLGIRAELLDAKSAAAREPSLRMDIAGAVYFPDDCHLSPARFMQTLRRLLSQQGVQILPQTTVTGWRLQNSAVSAITTSNGDFQADEYVLCGGAWSPGIARDLRLNIPMQAGKGYSLTLDHPPQLPDTCAILCEARVAVTPMGSSLRIGGTMEIAGLDETINSVRVQGIIKAVPRYFPEFTSDHFAGIRPWCGLRPCSPDGLPYIGRTRAWRNLSVAAGHAMMGLSLGPITGQLLSQVLAGENPSIGLQLLSPDRYA